MKFDATTDTGDFRAAAALGRADEDLGFDAIWSIEAQHEPFMPLAVASSVTEKLGLGTAIAVAFPRTPTILAYTAWDLQKSSGGRFLLGLGTQVKGHNERRFGVKWESPVKKLREVVLAMRAIWHSFQTGGKLEFKGEFFELTLMTPFFNPGPIDHPKIPVYLAGVNPLVCRMAGEVADGFHAHPFHSPKFLRETVLADLSIGLEKAGRTRADLSISTQCFAAVGDSSKEIAAEREKIRQQISFYASTRTYKPVLDAHGWGDVCGRLSRMAATGEWAKMPAEISDEMLDVYSVSGSAKEIAALVKQRYAGILDRVSLYFPFRPGENDARWKTVIDGMRG